MTSTPNQNTTTNLQDLEEIREGTWIRLGKDRYDRAEKKNQDKGRNSVTPPFVYVQKQLLIPLSERIEQFINSQYKVAGRRHTASEPLRDLDDPKKIALITLKIIIDCIASHKTLAQTGLQIGSMIEVEIQNNIFKAKEPHLHTVVLRDLLKRTSNVKHRKRVFAHTLNKYKVQVDKWDIRKQALVGLKLIDLCIKSTGLCQLKAVRERKDKTVNYLILKPEVEKKIKDNSFECSVLTPYYKAMVVPPKPYSTPFNGGFHNEYLSKQPLIKTHDYTYLHTLDNDKLKDFYDAVNHLQSVPFKIDKDMFQIFKEIWDNNLKLGKFPDRESLLDEKGKPKGIYRDPKVDEILELRIKYKRDLNRVYNDEIARSSKVLNTLVAIDLAVEYLEFERIYFAIFSDKRGRLYCMGTTITYQTDQKIKSLITFANSERLNERGKYWLYVHASNTWGNDKVSYDERYAFTESKLNEFISYAELPLDNKGWNYADKPMEFLNTCMNLKRLHQDNDFTCNLPVSMDATCSGLQVLSILMRDENTAKKVNVLPSSKPQDIYTAVAEKVKTEVELKASQGSSEANRWLQFGITRKIVKRNIMTYVYSLKPYGARQQIFDEYKSIIEFNPDKKVLADDGFSDCRWLAKIVWDKMEQEIDLEAQLMKWFQDCSKLFAKANIIMKWTTPMGFPVEMDYRYLIPFKVKTAISGSLVYTTYRRELNRKDSRKYSSSVSPNIVHSLDGAIAQAVALYCKNHERPINDLLMVHDSFATNPNRIDDLHSIIRNVVVDLFTEDYLDVLYNDWKSQLPSKLQTRLTPPPQRGNLDINKIKESLYFFS
jgi:DNA-directed RNA polymerase